MSGSIKYYTSDQPRVAYTIHYNGVAAKENKPYRTTQVP
jgi:hypothetical protein